MSSKKRYRPRAIKPLSWAIAMQGACLLSEEDQSIRVEPIRHAVELIAQGKGGKDEWQGIFDAFNMTEEFSRMPKVMQGATDYIHSMQSVIIGILDRQKASQTKALYPTELSDLRAFVDLWAELLTTVTHHEYFKAEENTHRRLRAILSSKTPGVRIVEAA